MARRTQPDPHPAPIAQPVNTESQSAPLTATQQLIVRTLKDMEDRLLRRRDLDLLRQMNRKQVAEELADVLLLSEIICCWDSGAGRGHPDDTCLIRAVREVAIPLEA